jgi:hypothetical protein
MSVQRSLLWLPRRVARWTSEHPFRAAGGVAAVAALLVSVLSLGATASDGVATLSVPPAELAGFAAAHPAYAAAVVVGLGVLLFARG